MFSSKFFKWVAGVLGAVLIAVLATIVNQWVSEKSPEVIARQYYNVVSVAAVPQKVGDLILDYEKPKNETEGVYIIEVSNEGRSPEEDLRVQATFPQGMNTKLSSEPDLRIYDIDEMNLDGNKFFLLLKNFPMKAFAAIQFVPPEDKSLLCHVDIKVAGKTIEGKVKPIEGVECE